MQSTPTYDLIETLRWSEVEGFYLLERHLDRLTASADKLGFKCARSKALDGLNQAVSGFTSPVERVRLLLHRDGTVTLAHTSITLPRPDDIMTFALSDKTTDSRDHLYQHKTTRRELYDRERVRLQKLTQCDEAIFTNERGEITEGSIMTIFLQYKDVLKTPPVSCGVLPGTLRAELLDDTTRRVEEAVLTLSDLTSADKIFLGNSVRGLMQAQQVL